MTQKNPNAEENRDLIILQEAVENTNVAFVTIDQQHQVVFFNKAAEDIFGYSRDEIIGQDLNLILTFGSRYWAVNLKGRLLKTP